MRKILSTTACTVVDISIILQIHRTGYNTPVEALEALNSVAARARLGASFPARFAVAQAWAYKNSTTGHNLSVCSHNLVYRKKSADILPYD